MFDGNFLKRLRLDRGLNQNELAKQIGIDKVSISRYERNRVTPNAKTLKKIADFFNIDIVDLYDEKTLEEKESEFIKIPIYGKVPAGIPLEAVQDIRGEVEIQSKMTKGGKEFLALEVSGYSMYPKFLEDDVIIVERTTDFKNGDIAVVYVNGYDATLKQIFTEGNKIRLHPFNPEYQDHEYPISENLVSVLGIVRELRRKI